MTKAESLALIIQRVEARRKKEELAAVAEEEALRKRKRREKYFRRRNRRIGVGAYSSNASRSCGPTVPIKGGSWV